MASHTKVQEGWYAQNEGNIMLGDGREIELLNFVFNHPSIDKIRGSPHRVVDAIDEFGRQKYMMNVGSRKGRTMTNLISDLKPEIMVELGGYIGYSAVLFGDAVRRTGGRRYYSLESNPLFAAITRSFVDLAGLSDIVKVEVGTSDGTLRRLHASGELKKIDLLFIDHYKPAYTHDLKLCEQLQLVRPGSTVAADNVIHPGAPDYLAYVRSGVQEKLNKAASGEARETKHPSNTNWFLNKDQKPTETLMTDVVGVPNLVYRNELIKSFEPNGIPDGIQISTCIDFMP